MDRENLNQQLLEAVKQGDTGRMWELVEQGADINSASNKYGWTALWLSAYNGHLTPELLEALVSMGADINARDENGLTALWLSAYNGYLTPELLQVFISNGADINAQNEDCNTVLMIAADEDCVTPELARAFANEFIRLGMSLEEIHNQTADINSAAVLVYVLLKKLETEPWIVVDFMKKHVGKKLQEWVDNGVEGADILVSRLAHQIRQKEFMSEGSGTQNMDFF